MPLLVALPAALPALLPTARPVTLHTLPVARSGGRSRQFVLPTGSAVVSVAPLAALAAPAAGPVRPLRSPSRLRTSTVKALAVIPSARTGKLPRIREVARLRAVVADMASARLLPVALAAAVRHAQRGPCLQWVVPPAPAAAVPPPGLNSFASRPPPRVLTLGGRTLRGEANRDRLHSGLLKESPRRPPAVQSPAKAEVTQVQWINPLTYPLYARP